MIELALGIYCSYRNALLARRKGQNTVAWVLITLVSYFILYFITFMVLVLAMYRGPMAQEPLFAYLQQHPLMQVTFMVCGLGGYLFARYLLERMPDAGSPGEE